MSTIFVCGILVLFINVPGVWPQGRSGLSRGRGRGVRYLVPIMTWPDGTVPYEIPDDFDERSRALIKVAMRRWERQTCVQFVPRSEHAQPGAYIKFYKSNTSCFSDIGRSTTQQPQLLGLSQNCMGISSIVHELGHALGMIHPMSRDDRDQFITLRTENINPGADRNFLRISDRGYMYIPYDVPYDYKSIMHYDAKMWSGNGNVTMVTVEPEFQSIIGTADDISFTDSLYIYRAYRCYWQCPWMRCENGGFASGSPCKCVCPDGFHGNYCEKRLPGVGRIVNWRCRPGWFHRAGMCYRFLSHATVPLRTAQTLCQQNRGHLPRLTDTEILRITGELVNEDTLKELSTTKTFWLGLQLNATSGLYTWSDGSSLKNPEWVSLPEDPSANRSCAVFDGKAISATSCGLQSDNGVLCVAPFDPTCGGVFHLSTGSVEMTSPNYPELYPPDITCQYVFKISQNNKIQITITDFLLEYSENCESDSVEVQTDVSIPGKRYCGTKLRNQTLVSDGHFLILTLRTNSRNQGRGFRLTADPVYSRARSTTDHFLNIPMTFWKKLFEIPGRFGLRG